MVDDQFHRLQWIDLLRSAAQRYDAVAHGRQIHHTRHAGKVLEEDPRRHEGNFLLGWRLQVPCRERPDVVGLDEAVIFAAQQILKEDLQ